MADKKFNLQFEATLEIGKMKTALDQINKSLTQTSVNLPKGVSSTLNKTIQSIRTEMMKLEGLDGIELSPQAAKDVSKTYNSLFKNFQNLKVIMGDIGREFKLDPQLFFPKEISENIDNATKALNKYINALNKGPQTEEYKALVEDLKKANRALEEYNDKASKAETKGKIATTRKDELQKELNIQKNISAEAEQAVKSAQDQIDMAQAQARTLKQIEALERKIAEAENRRAKAQAKSDQKAEQMSSKKRTDTKVYAELESSKTKADAEVAAETTLIERYRQEIQAATESAQKIQIAEEQKTQALERAANARKEVKKAERGISSQEETIKQATAEFTTYSLEAQKAEASVTELAEKQKKANEAFQTSALKVLVNELNQLGIKVPEVSQNLPSIQKIINNLSSEPIQQITQALEKAGADAEELGIDLSQVGNKSQEFVELSEAQKRSADEMQRLKSQILDFFSVTNAIQLFKRTVQSALNTVKELDAVMTETAVVTDFSVGDMWERLPEYSAEATKLGASIKDLYAATTLYYQQGLQTEAAMGVGIETMKMARIAGMEAAGATEAMTAALRGFNMEVNETNAIRVNDVYSKLAAITAADTAQIATAMSKTASIAASANMEFETTAALLAQIIETTQEAPETAGTALKTITARFAEVKKLRSEGTNTGEDEEGEIIDVNKIQGALRTVGISMDEFFAGTKGLDSILLELAEKWNTLDFETQRYIATTAAGSRQQSRFIAMMSDYERTMELATAANNSAGASQQQFNKTLESMEAKLQKMHNAWNQFTMGLANNQILKGGVDLLTGLLKAINGLTEAVSGGNGAVKSVLNLGVALMGLKTGGAVLGGILASISSAQAGKGFNLGKNVKTGFANAFSGLKNIKPNIPKIDFDTAGLKAYQAQLNSYKTSITEVTAAESVLTQVRNNKRDATYAALAVEDAMTHSDQQLALASAQVAAATGLENAQAKEAVLLNSQGLSLEWAVAAAKAGVTAEGLKEAAVQEIENAAGKKGIVISQAELIAKQKEILARKGVFVAINTGIMGRIEEIAMTKLGIASTLAKVAADKLETAGLKAKTAAMIASLGVIGLIIAAVAALIAIIVALYKNAYANSLEGRMEAAKKATEEAKTAAEEAKKAYDNLLNSKTEYNELQTTLDNLTKGTQGWKQALIEANEQVLELLETYPELAKYIGRGEHGQLTISDEGWEQTQKIRFDQMNNTQAMVYGSQIVELDLKKEQAQGKLDSAINPYFIEGEEVNTQAAADAQNKILEAFENTPEIFADLGKMSVEQFKAAANKEEIWNNSEMARKFGKMSSYDKETGQITFEDGSAYNIESLPLSEGITEFNDGLYALAESTGITAEVLADMKNSVSDYSRFMEDYNQQMQLYTEQFMSGLSEEVAGSQFAGQITSAVAQNYSKNGASDINAQKMAYLDNKTGKDEIKKLATELIGKGHIITDTNGSEETYRQVYEALSGQDAGEMTKEKLAAEIAKIQVSDEWTQTAEDLIASLDKLAATNEDAAKLAGAIISKDSSNLSLTDMMKVLSGGEEGLGDLATQLGYGSVQDFAEAQQYKEQNLSSLSKADQVAYAKRQGVSDEEIDNWLAENADMEISAQVQLEIDYQQFLEELEAEKTSITNTIDSIMGETGYVEKSPTFVNLDTGTLKGLSEQAASMGQESGKAYLEQFEDMMRSSNLSKDEADRLASYLSTIDWSNMTEAMDAMDQMQAMGLKSNIIKNFWLTATNGAKTYVSTLTEMLSLSERIQKKMQNVDTIETNLSEGKGTYDDVMELVNAGVDISEFQLTPEGWKATADQIEEATDKLKEYNAEQAKLQANKQREAFQAAKESWARFGNNGTSIIDQLTTENEAGEKVAGTITTQSEARAIGYVIGESGIGENEDLDVYINRIQEAYNSYIDILNNGEDLQIIADKQAAMAEAAKYSATEREYGETVINYDESGNPSYGGIQGARSEESLLYSVQNEAGEVGLDPTAVQAYADALQNVHTGLSDVNAAQIALANSKLNAGLGEIIDSYDEWTGLIDKKSGLIKATSSDDIEAFNKLKASTNKMLNTSEDLSDAFWDNATNMKNLKKAAEGDTKALEDLQKAAASDYLQNMDIGLSGEALTEAKNEISEFTDYLDKVDIPKLEAGVEWKGQDAQKFINNFNDMASAANMSADQIQNAVKAMGFDAEITYKEDTRMVPTENTERVIEDYDETSGMPTKWHTVTTPGAPVPVAGTFPVVKTLTASGAGGGGISEKNKKAAAGNKKKGGGGGGGGGSKKEKWENPYDKQYNTVQKINNELRKREKLEKRYQNLLAKSNTTATDLSKNTQKQVAAVKKEMQYRNKLLNKRKDEMKSIEKKNKKYEKYAYYDEKEGRVVIDWNAINKIKDPEKGKKVEDYIKKLEEKDDQIKEQEDELEEQTAILREIYDQGKDEYFDLENQIKDALVDERQKEIDKLSAINDSINDTNTRLIDAMQSSIDKYRQDRENARTEEELSDKQRRLAYLRQDTSGANALEIMQLEKELGQGQEDYTDTLVDQKISELQQQNDEAAEQRERQIQIAQAQLDKWVESGEIWNDVYDLIGKGIGNEGIIPGSKLEEVLRESAGYKAMSDLQQSQWGEDIQNMATAALSWLNNGLTTQALVESGRLEKGQKIDFTTSDGKSVKGRVQKDGTVKTDTGEVYKNVRLGYDGKWITEESYLEPKENKKTTTTEKTTTTTTNQDKKIKVGGKINAKGAKIYGNIGGEGQTQHFKDDPIYKVLDEKNGYLKVRHHKLSSGVSGWFKKKDVKAYKTGGLADFTGPAWLDGTKSKPEYILNAEQTKSFFELVDVLGSLKGGTSQSSQITGDSIYDVDINVESIGSDYDVEKLATTIKRMINDDARYRNNNAINLQR